MSRYVLALDQGTTSSRSILFDRGGNIVAAELLVLGAPDSGLLFARGTGQARQLDTGKRLQGMIQGIHREVSSSGGWGLGWKRTRRRVNRILPQGFKFSLQLRILGCIRSITAF